MATKKSKILLKSELPEGYKPKLGDLIKHKSGRIHEYVMKDDRLVPKWRSDRPEMGTSDVFPLREHFLCAHPLEVKDSKGVLTGYVCQWITRGQLNDSYRAVGKSVERGGIEDLLGFIARVIDNFQEKHVNKKSYIIKTVLNTGIDSIQEKLLRPHIIEGLVDGFLGDKLS